MDQVDDREPKTVQVVPGRWGWIAKLVAAVVVALWCSAAAWIGWYTPTSSIPWSLGWWIVAAVVVFHAVRLRWSPLIVASTALAWPAYGSPGLSWSWVVYGWLITALALPAVLARVFRPVWSTRRALAGNVFGEPSWGRAASAAVAHELTVIPGVRVIHQTSGADHAVVLGRRVALITDDWPPVVDGFIEFKMWPCAVETDPQRAVDEIGAWLLAGADGWVVDRRALAIAAARLRPSR